MKKSLSDPTPPKMEFYLFIVGSLISSTGSNTFAIASLTFLPAAGFGLASVASLIIVSRASLLLTTFMFGNLSDALGARKVLLATEVMGLVASVGLWVAWERGAPGFSLFLAFAALRAVAGAIQTPAKSSIAKRYASDDFASQSRFAVWVNKSTLGTMLFGALIALVFFQFGSFPAVILFDALTFIFNGLIILKFVSLPPPEVNSSFGAVLAGTASRTWSGVIRFYRGLSAVAWRDFFLNLSFAGVNVLSVRIAGNDFKMIIILSCLSGLSLWISGFLYRMERFRPVGPLIWLLLSATFIAQGALVNVPPMFMVVYFLNHGFFWWLYHHLSSELQHRADKDEVASVVSARLTQLILISIAGEFAVSRFAELWAVDIELYWRAVLCLGVFCAAWFTGTRTARSSAC